MSVAPSKTSGLRRLVVMFDRFGPYHVARLNALGALGRDFTVTGLECFGQSEEYAWEKVSTPPSFQRVTLFPDHSASQGGELELTARVRAALTAAQPEAVAIPGWSHPGARAALQWCVESRTPAILMSESTAHDAPRAWAKEWIKARIVGLFSAALVGGRPHAEYLAQLGFPTARIFTGYDAVDNEHFASGQKSEIGSQSERPSGLPLTTDLCLMTSGRFFLASARFIEKKNLPRLLEAYALYRELAATSDLRPLSSDLWNLVLLGDGPLRADLCALIADLSLQSSVHLPGFIQYDELPAWYARASAFVHASTHEPWGLVVNEAMAAGLPVLVSNHCGCAPELVQEGVNGFTFDPNDARQLAALLEDMAQRSDRDAMGRESRRIISRWNTTAFASGMKAAVEQALGVGPVNATLFLRVILNAMLRR